ncbi:signal peptidase II [bacterium]|nr:MAG: signal peptidase II [bacterium]
MRDRRRSPSRRVPTPSACVRDCDEPTWLRRRSKVRRSCLRREIGGCLESNEVPSHVVAAKRALFWATLVGTLIVDQIVKAWTRNSLNLEQTLPVPWPGVFEIRRAYNEGIAFGMFQGKGVFLTPVAVVIAAGAIWYVYKHKKESRWNHVAFGLLASGALGNLYDFNVADACITIATIMLMIGWWKESAKKEPAVAEPPLPS